MSKVLTSFLVGIGYDTKGLDAGSNKIQGSMQGIKSGALGISAALVGAFGAATASAIATAQRVDQLALSTQNLRTSQDYIYNYGNALKLLGGDAGDALTTVQRFEEILNNLRLKGELGPLAELPLAGVDITGLTQAQSGEDFMRQLASQIPALDDAQRSLVQETLGLSDAVFKSLAGGADELDRVMEKANNLTGNVEQLNENSRKLAENTAAIGLAIEGVTNELADKLLPGLVGFTDWVNSAIEGSKEEVSNTLDFVAENQGATAAATAGIGAAAVGAGLSKIGLGGVGGAVTKAGTAGLAVGGSALAARATNEYLASEFEAYNKASAGFDAMLRDVLGVERIMGPSELLFGGFGNTASRESMDGEGPTSGFSPSDAMPPPTSAAAADEERRANAAAIAGALSRSPVKVENTLNVQLDGQAIEAKIVDVTERMSYSTLEDISSTTER